MEPPEAASVVEALTAARGDQRLPLAGELALVTGAGQRIGRAIATGLATAGADVVVHHRTSPAAAEVTARDVARLGRRGWSLQGELGTAHGPTDLVEAAVELSGRAPTLLVNNASTFPQHGLRDLSREVLLEAVTVNAWAPLALARAMADRVEAGAVVNLLDARVGHADRARTAYALSKDLLASMTRLLALELAPNVRVNAVAPGPILPPSEGPSDAFERIGRATPLGCPGDPAYVAEAVVHLLAAPYTTGAVLPVSGGQHLAGGTTVG